MSKTEQSYRQTIEQLRAQWAWKAIEEVERSNYKNEYGTLARGQAAMIQINGLAASMAFIKSKAGGGRDKNKENEYTKLYDHLSGWIKYYLQPQQTDLMDLIRLASTDTYRRATAEAIAYSIWLKRYVDSKEWKSSNNG